VQEIRWGAHVDEPLKPGDAPVERADRRSWHTPQFFEADYNSTLNSFHGMHDGHLISAPSES